MEIFTKNAAETSTFGEKIGATLKGGEVIALSGELGAGKTTFVQGIAKGLNIEKNIISPTFILMRKYGVKNHLNVEFLSHLDLYRLEEDIEEELENLGVYEDWGSPKNVFIIEWAEKIKHLPMGTIKINIDLVDENTRKFTYENLF